MNRRTFTTQTFTRDDGIMADEFNRYHYVQFPEGNMLMGGLEGFTLFNPRQIGQDTFEPVVELTNFRLIIRSFSPICPHPTARTPLRPPTDPFWAPYPFRQPISSPWPITRIT